MEFGFLEEVGLTKNEAKIYVTLLNIGSATAGVLIHETDLHSSRVYEGLNRLIAKGLVSSVKKDSLTYFEATDPEKIIDYLEEEKVKIEEKQKKVLSILPQLKKIHTRKPSAEAHVFLGIEGFKAMRRDVLKNAKKEHLLIGAISREDEILPHFFLWWNKQRIKNRIKMKILHKESARDKPMTRLTFSETRFLPPEINNPAVINIYGDRVVNVLWKEKYPLCFMLINKDIADAYRRYFELLWKSSKS